MSSWTYKLDKFFNLLLMLPSQMAVDKVVESISAAVPIDP